MRPGLLTRLLFVSYCLEAGMFLVMVPWSPAWDRTAIQIPIPFLAAIFHTTFARAALSGFGMVHLIWGVHDLNDLWPRPRREVPAAASVASEVSGTSDAPSAGHRAAEPETPGAPGAATPGI